MGVENFPRSHTETTFLDVISKNTVICSNHFKYGRPTAVSPYPTFYLKGYNIGAISSKRKPPEEITIMKQNDPFFSSVREAN